MFWGQLGDSGRVFSCIHMRLASKSELRKIMRIREGFMTFRARTRKSPSGFDPRLAHHPFPLLPASYTKGQFTTGRFEMTFQ